MIPTVLLLLPAAAAGAPSANGISSQLVCEMKPGVVHVVDGGPIRLRPPQSWTVVVSTPLKPDDLVAYEDPLIGKAAPKPIQWARPANFVGVATTRNGKKEWTAIYSVLLSSPGEALIRTDYMLAVRRQPKDELYALTAEGSCRELLSIPRQETR
jgi:hypothetical protein